MPGPAYGKVLGVMSLPESQRCANLGGLITQLVCDVKARIVEQSFNRGLH